MNDHITAEDLAAYVDGVLEEGKKAELESHVSRCSECLDALGDIAAVQRRRDRIPRDFLRRALGEKPAAKKTVLPLRLVFEIAAAFLVVIVLGYFFLGGNRFWQTEGMKKEKEGAIRPLRQTTPADDKEGPALVGGVARAGAAERSRMPVEKKAEVAVPAPEPGGKKDRVAAVREQKSALPAGNRLNEQGQNPPAFPARAETDKMSDAQVESFRSAPAPAAAEAAQPAMASQARTAMAKKKGLADMAAPGRFEEVGTLDEKSFPSPSREAAAVSRALRLFLAAAGRPVDPGGMKMAAPAPRSRIQVDGDVAWADLLDPKTLDGWSWFREGMVLELQVNGAGEVTAVIPLGQWDHSQVEAAIIAARKLTFSVSRKKSRRARISLSGSPPN